MNKRQIKKNYKKNYPHLKFIQGYSNGLEVFKQYLTWEVKGAKVLTEKEINNAVRKAQELLVTQMKKQNNIEVNFDGIAKR